MESHIKLSVIQFQGIYCNLQFQDTVDTIYLETVPTSKTRYIHGYKKEVYRNVHIPSNRLTPIFKVYRNSQFQGIPRI